MRLPIWVILAALVGVLPATGEIVLDRTGRLRPGQETTLTGEWLERHELRASAGDVLRVRCESREFDAYLIIHTPENAQYDGDDVGTSLDAQVVLPILHTGVVSIAVTSSRAGMQGRYRLRVERRRVAGGVAALAKPVARFAGKLTPEDARLYEGAPVDIYSWRVPADHFVMAVVTSALGAVEAVVRLPDQPEMIGGAATLSQVAVGAVSLREGQVAFGAVAVGVATAEYGISLWVAPLEPATPPELEAFPGLLTAEQRLDPQRDRLPDGRLAWSYFLPVLAGERLRFRLETSDFAPRLILEPSAGEPVEVDGAQGEPPEAEITCTKPGVLWVNVMARDRGGSGAFKITCPAAEPAPPPR